MKRVVAAVLVALFGIVSTGGVSAVARTHRTTTSPNVLLVIADDQRFDKITPQYMPNVYAWSQLSTSRAFTDSFVPNPLCCPSRTTILTGRYSHSTGVWTNVDGPTGGFSAFNDAHTLGTDFLDQGYRTAMIGKYLNGYNPGETTYVPPGWSKWFATRTGDYYDYLAQTKVGTESYGSTNNDYSTKVIKQEALDWIANGSTKPWFMYLSFSAPHGPAIPQSLDVGRFAGQNDYTFGAGTSMLESAYGVDRAFGQILAALPTNTVVVYMSDNGFMWGENHPGHGTLDGKLWPYNTSIRVPIIIGGLGNSVVPIHAGVNDVVSNVDLRTSLEHAAGIAPESPQAGVNWFDPGYVPRDALLLEHYDPSGAVTYCGARSASQMYVRFQNSDGSHTTETYQYTGQGSPADEQQQSNTDPSLAALAQSDCGVPEYNWP